MASQGIAVGDKVTAWTHPAHLGGNGVGMSAVVVEITEDFRVSYRVTARNAAVPAGHVEPPFTMSHRHYLTKRGKTIHHGSPVLLAPGRTTNDI